MTKPSGSGRQVAGRESEIVVGWQICDWSLRIVALTIDVDAKDRGHRHPDRGTP
jgi:hypothetical protein